LTLAEMLEPDGHAIDIAENGAEALKGWRINPST